jgi:sulfatase modifying factor 1
MTSDRLCKRLILALGLLLVGSGGPWDIPGSAQEPGQGLSPETITNSLGMKFTLIKAGEFLMGSPDTDKDAEDAEKPQHRVRITRPFYLGVHEVTRGQFRQFVDNAGYQTEAEKDGKGGFGWNESANNIEQNPRYTWREAGFEQTDLHPVVNVSWNDAVAFAKWLSQKEGKTYRLPTEAEWEYACRAGTTTRYFCGDDAEGLAEVGNVADGTAKAKHPDWTTIAAQDGFVYTSPVGHYRPNAWGLYDMHGNVLEWCWDCYGADFYEGSRVDDPAGLVQAPFQVFFRVFRGGSWDGRPRVCRSANRFRDWPVYRESRIGFRVALVPKQA